MSDRLEDDFDLDGFHRGDEAAVEWAYRAYGRALLRHASRVVGVVDAESVVHDVFVEILRQRELRMRFSGGSLSAWLHEITRFKALEHRRRQADLPRQEPGQPVEGSASVDDEVAARLLLERFLEKHVPEAQRRFFALRFLDRRTQVEIAMMLGAPRSTLEGWEHRLAHKLRAFALEGA